MPGKSPSRPLPFSWALALLPGRAWRGGTAAWAAARRTSVAGLWCVVALTVSSTVTAVAHVPAVSALPATPYGQALLVSGVLSTSAPPQFPRAVAVSVPVQVSYAGQSAGGRVNLSGRGRLEVTLDGLDKNVPLRVVLLPVRGTDHADHASHLPAGQAAALSAGAPGRALRLSRNRSEVRATRQLWTPGRWAVAVELRQAVQLVPLELR